LPVGEYRAVALGFCLLIFLVPSSNLKTLWDLLPVGMNAHLFASSAVPTCEVAPLSVMADGIEPLRTLRFVVMV
jgi:hypothetical protein